MKHDDRTPAEVKSTIGFWLATDKSMSGWGGASGGRSIVACPCINADDAYKVEKHFNARPEFKRVRWVSGNRLNIRLGSNDHCHIYDTTNSFRF